MNRVKRCRYGEMIHQPHDAYIGRSLDLYGEFSESEVALFRELIAPGQTVLDVGANIGAHTVALATLVGPTGRVLAFEPQHALFYCLCGNVALNALDQVRCQQSAVGDSPGQIQVPELDYSRENNFGGISLAQDLRGRATYSVPLVRIDDLKLAAVPPDQSRCRGDGVPGAPGRGRDDPSISTDLVRRRRPGRKNGGPARLAAAGGL